MFSRIVALAHTEVALFWKAICSLVGFRLFTDELFFLPTLTLFDLKSATKQKWRGGLSTIEACIGISQ